MARTKQTARKSTGGIAPRKPMDASRVAFGSVNPSWATAKPVFQQPAPAALGRGGGGSDFPCCVEYAKSARSQCKACSRQIPNGAVRIGQQYDRDHSGYLWYHVDCFPNFPRDGSTTAESFLFGFEKLAPKAQALVQNAFEGRTTASAKRGAISDDDDDDDDEEEEEDYNSPEESEGDSAEEDDDDDDKFSRSQAQSARPFQQPRQFQLNSHHPGETISQLAHQQQLLLSMQQLLQQQPKQLQAMFGSPSPWSTQPSTTMTATEAVAGLAEAVSAAGLARGAFFAQPPQVAHRALRAAVEAYEISADAEELADTLALIQRHFAR